MIKNNILCYCALTLIIIPSLVFAQSFGEGVNQNNREDGKAYFKQVITIPSQKNAIPQIFEISPFESATSTAYYLVDTTTGEKNNGYIDIKQSTEILEKKAQSRDFQALSDNNFDTYQEFPYKGKDTEVRITLTSDAPISSSRFELFLSNYVTAPDRVALYATTANGEKAVVVAERPLTGTAFYFPLTVSNEWELVFKLTQPLRIQELKIVDAAIRKEIRSEATLRFLIQPNHSYELYVDAGFGVKEGHFFESNYQLANVTQDEVKNLTVFSKQPNMLFKEIDTDGDTVADVRDNCPQFSNFDQGDEDGDSVGNPCDDRDYDGIMNSFDNCIDKPNGDQRDIDADGIGNACDKEESRLTEKYPWLPWVGIGVAALVLVVLVALTARDLRKKPENLSEIKEGDSKEHN